MKKKYEMENEISFADRKALAIDCRKFREVSALTQMDLAFKLGLTVSSEISRIERGISNSRTMMEKVRNLINRKTK